MMHISPQGILTLYKFQIRTHLEYASLVWCSTASTSHNRMGKIDKMEKGSHAYPGSHQSSSHQLARTSSRRRGSNGAPQGSAAPDASSTQPPSPTARPRERSTKTLHSNSEVAVRSASAPLHSQSSMTVECIHNH